MIWAWFPNISSGTRLSSINCMSVRSGFGVHRTLQCLLFPTDSQNRMMQCYSWTWGQWTCCFCWGGKQFSKLPSYKFAIKNCNSSHDPTCICQMQIWNLLGQQVTESAPSLSPATGPPVKKSHYTGFGSLYKPKKNKRNNQVNQL